MAKYIVHPVKSTTITIQGSRIEIIDIKLKNSKYIRQVKSVYGQILKTPYVTRQRFLGGTNRLPYRKVCNIDSIDFDGKEGENRGASAHYFVDETEI